MQKTTRALSLLLCICLLIPMTLGLFSCSKEPATENRVTSVTLDKGEITVEAALTTGFLEGYTEKKIYLFELPSHYSADFDLDELDPVAEAKPRGRVKFTLSAMDGVRSRLFSSYLIASFDPATKAYTPLTPPTSLSNPEAAATYTPPAESPEGSIKGLISDSPADAIRLGVSHTVVEVSMDNLILSSWRKGATAYIYDGTTRYLDTAALTELDETVGVYTAAGVEVFLRFSMGSPEGKDIPIGLYVPGVANAEDYAVNMTTPFAADIMEGFFDFMAARYAAPADSSRPVSGFIMGYRVNSGVTHNAATGMDLAAYVTNYEKLTRVAHTALRSHNPAGRIYISLDSRRAVGTEGGWDVATFLSAFADESRLRGDYPWHVACELYADTPAVWEENAAADTAHYTIRNLGTLTDLLDGTVYRFADQPRRLLIGGYEIPAVGQGETPSGESDNRQAASYAYAYLTCVQNGRVEALIYSAYTDPAPTAAESPLCGLWTVKADADVAEEGVAPMLRPATTRPIYDVFKRIDTTESATLSTGLTAVMGASYTKLESALSGKASPVTYVQGSTSLEGHDPVHKKASPLYTFGDGHTGGFTDGGGLTYLELTEAETLGLTALHARFDRDRVCEPMGLTVTLPATDLIGGKEMIFDLYAGQKASTGSSARPTVTLRLTRPATGSAADGQGEIRYEASVYEVKSGSWQTASFDITPFTTLLNASDEVTMTLILDYPTSTAPDGSTTHDMGLAGVYLTGHTAATGTPAGLVIGIVAVLILLVVGVFVCLLIRYRKKR